ncbi:ABC transporter ATP-binding protein [Streptomyces sp. DSM 44915]|uniref:ABC transporter ATP-binding protein n=1 Tax=Streptomyces chisholmiae TaxID=3075540 RepID=A0ABU2JU49_9ACTN|nr:ABC transporter ATP-binding protein [Streptomyces sp. DSM 44915]MDT0268039.1 ABC transporter ATP-binding protein [Streptomyces sp. DSM 44915]
MNVIEVTGLRKSYPERTAVDGVSFQVGRGEIFGLAGPNGGGKTTLVECLSGLRRPDGGTVRVLGHDPWRERSALHQRIGVQLQDSRLPGELRVGEALRLYSTFYREPADWRELMATWELTDRRNTAFNKLSGGWRQRLLIALALVGKPELVVLDELTTGLDPYARRATWAMVRELRTLGVTVVLVSHFMDEAEALCDRVAVLGAGRLLALGSPAELVAEAGADNLEEAFLDLVEEYR